MSPPPRPLLLLLLALACRGAPTGEQAAETISLRPGAVYVRSLAEGSPHRFRFEAAADQFLHFTIEQRAVDVVVWLTDPSGKVVFEGDHFDGRRAPETVLAVTPRHGTHVLRVEPLTAGVEGVFALSVREARPARPEDHRRAATATFLARGERRLQEGDFEAAAAAFQAALPGLERQGDAREVLRAQWRLGRALVPAGDLREAVRLLERAVAGFRDLGDGIAEAKACNDLGAAWRLLGEPGRALDAYQRALDLYRAAGVPSGEAAALNNIGLALAGIGDLEGAIEQYEAALGIWQRIGAQERQAPTLENLGSLYSLIGHDREALDLLRKALALTKGGTDELRHMSVLIALGWAEFLAGDPEQALNRYDEAVAIAQRAGNHLAEAGIWDRRATALRVLGRTREASADYERALATSREAGSLRNEGHTLANLGWLHLDMEDFPRARGELQRAADLLAASRDPNGEVYARVGLSRAERRLGRFGEARQQVETALRRIEEMRLDLRGSASRGQFLATRYDAFEEMVSLLMELDRREPGRGHARQALEVAERARARNLLEQMTGESPAPGTSDDAARRRALQAEIQALEERRRALERSHPRDPRLRGIAAGLRERSLELDRLAAPAPPAREALTARQIQDLAGPGTRLIVYLLAEPESFAWTVDRERIVAHVLPGRKKIERIARRVSAALPKSHEVAARATAAQMTQELSEAILAPLGERLREAPRLVILPDGALHLIPFAALPEPSALAGKPSEPLLVGHEILVLPSATALVHQRQRLAGRPAASRQLAVLADSLFSPADPRLRPDGSTAAGEIRGFETVDLGNLPRLPFTAAEAEAIARLVPRDQRLVALGTAASRDLVTSGTLSRFRILHFATHGLVHPVLPEKSGIVLSLVDEKGRPREGFLAAPDVAALDLPADLVVLSACQTGLGREVRGEGLVGLTQAFFQAGARRVVVSSWNIQDRSTAELMGRFYRHLLVDRLPPAAALRAAQLSLRSEERTSAPSFWAGFTLHGDWL